MAELAELEHRIIAALARINAGLDKWPGPGPSDKANPVDPSQVGLDAGRSAPAAEGQASPNPLQVEVDRLTRQLDAQGLDTQRLRSSVAQLREEVRRLREAAESGLADAALINRAMQAELDALRAARASETTEIGEILAALAPLIDTPQIDPQEARPHA